MDALVSVCSWNTNVIMVWAWMLCERMLLEHGGGCTWFGHGCSGERMLLEHGGGCTCSTTLKNAGCMSGCATNNKCS